MADERERPISRLVTSTDFSVPAEAGLAWARSLAVAHGAALHVVHVVPPAPRVGGRLLVSADVAQSFVEAARQRLEAMAAPWRESGLEVVCHVETGLAEEGILQIAETHGADAVVLSTRGYSGLRHVLSGSTTRRVVRRALRPVLTIHPEATEPVPHPDSVLAAVDFSRHSLGAVDAALALLPPGPRARLRLLHSWYLPVGLEVYGYGSSAELLSALAADREEVRKRLEELAARLRRPGLEVDVRLVEGFPDSVILSEAHAMDAQVIAMGTQGLSGVERWVLGSIAERVVQQASCAVLTARAPEPAG